MINIIRNAIKGTNNILYLERVLDVKIIDAINAEFQEHFDNLSNGILVNGQNKVSFQFIFTKFKTNSRLVLQFGNKRETLINFKQGIPYNNKGETLLGKMKYLHNCLDINLFTFNSKFTRLEQLSLEYQEKINTLAIQDINQLAENKKLKPNTSSSTLFRKSKIITTARRQELFSNGTICLTELVGYDLYQYIIAVNKSIKFYVINAIKQIIIPTYLSGLEENRWFFKLAGRMKLEDSHHKYLQIIPKTYKVQMVSLLYKYQMGFKLLISNNDLRKLDTDNLIKNDAHPKLIKNLVVKYYKSIAGTEITEKIVTKILRWNVRLFQEIYDNSNWSNVVGEGYFESFLMIIFSDMPQIVYLNYPKKNKTEIKEYADTFIEFIKFLKHFHSIDNAIRIVKLNLRKNINSYINLIVAIRNAEVELRRFIRTFNYISIQASDELRHIENWSIKKITNLHNSITKNLLEYKLDKIDLMLTKRTTEHLHSKIIEREVFSGYVFEQLVSREELHNEGKLMKHCVASYYATNLFEKLFILSVYPEQEPSNFINSNRSTLALIIDKKQLWQQQNYTLNNEGPSLENQNIVRDFILNKRKNKHAFFDYIEKSNKLLDNKNIVSHDDLNATVYLNNILFEIGAIK